MKICSSSTERAGSRRRAARTARSGRGRRRPRRPSGSLPSSRGSVSTRSASARVSVSGDCDLSRDAFFSPVVTYGPYRPDFSTIGSPVSGCSPILRSPPPPRNSSSTFSGVSSSGAMPSGSETRSPAAAVAIAVVGLVRVGRLAGRNRSPTPGTVRCRYGPYRPTRTTTSRPASSRNSGIELMPRASISPRFSVTIRLSPPPPEMVCMLAAVAAEVERPQEVQRGRRRRRRCRPARSPSRR